MALHSATIVWRQLVRNRSVSLINLVGLTLSLTCSLLIYLWVRDELSVDRFHANGPWLYTVMERAYYDGRVEARPVTPGLLAEELKKQVPEIVYAAGFSSQTGMTFSVGNKTAKQRGHFAGADWFSMFSIPVLAGRPETALSTPNSLAISRQLAENYFGSVSQALGKAIRINNEQAYQVTAVFENLPANSSDQYDFLLNWADYLRREPWMSNWGNNSPHTRIQVRPTTNVVALETKLQPFLRAYNKDINANFDIQLFLQAYPDGYLYGSFKNGQPDGGRIEYVRLFSLIALFILLIACINFMNLATAQSEKRAKDAGIRKVLGAERWRLVGRFLGETTLLTMLALGLAVGLLIGLLPFFNQLTSKHIVLPLAEPTFWLILVALVLLTSTAAGLYPALFLSSFHPIRVLQGRFKPGSASWLLRQGLVVFQFALAVLFIIGTLVVYRQIQYVQSKNSGYDREHLVYLSSVGELAKNYTLLKRELLQQPSIQAVSFLQSSPIDISSSTGGLSWPGKDPNALIMFTHCAVGYDFVRTMNLTLLQGRDFSPAYSTDTTNYLINESAAKRIGYRNPVGQPLTQWGRAGQIIGVIKDFHLESLYEPIKPLVIRLTTDPTDVAILVRTQPGQTKSALTHLEKTVKSLNPAIPFSYYFADDEYQKLYSSEVLIERLATYFASLAIFISCLGLFGLARFITEQRTKEIGVRKVLGASVLSVVTLLSRDFLKLVLLALVIAVPLAGYAMRRWLSGYAYRIELDWWLFVLSGALAIAVALLTVSFQSIKAALVNPVKSLRSE